MAFVKQAKVSLTRIASATLASDGSLQFEKQASGPRSYFDGPGKIDVGALLKAVASTYDISANPSDYIFEAARAVTAEVPNENGDAFPRSELLRFDSKLKTPVFATFIGKPHHINHKADNPKTARGVVIAAHYHDDLPAADTCPSCGTKTAAVEDRDDSGIACKKCGSIVKDEFVELLLAVDTKKDPTFANGVKNGSLDGLSMGCFVAGTEITLHDGSTTSIENIKIGDQVLTHNGNIAKVTELSKVNHAGQIIDLDISGIGDKISLTPNHPLLVLTDSGPSWMHAEHVKSGDVLLSPKVAAKNAQVPDYLPRLLGWYLAEGNLVYKNGDNSEAPIGVEFTLNISEVSEALEIKSLLTAAGVESPHEYIRPERNIRIIKTYTNPAIANILSAHGGTLAKSKRLSPEVLQWSKEDKLQLIGALVQGDGCQTTRGKKSARRVAICTSSRTLARQITVLCNSVGLTANMPKGRIISGFGSQSPSYYVEVSSTSQNLLVGYSSKVIHQNLKTKRASLGSFDTGEFIARKIRRVSRREFNSSVYNFEVDHIDHSYIANGISAHNCTAGYTDCSICNNRARSVSQFCTHIKSGNKKKQYKTASGMKMAFEKCGEVIFTEISRVDQPADPTARQREILQVKAGASLEDETKALIAATLVNRFKMSKAAQMDKGKPDVSKQNLNVDKAKGDALEALDGIKDVMPDMYNQLKMDLDNVDAGGLGTMENYVNKVEDNNSGQKTEAEVGMSSGSSMSPSGSGMGIIQGYIADRLKEITSSTGNQMIFANAYKVVNAAVTTAGNVTVSTPNGRLFVIKPEVKPVGKQAAVALANEILTSIGTNGLLDTVTKYNAILSPKVAQVLEHHIEDFVGGRPDDNDPITADGQKLNDMAEKREKPADSVLDDAATDMADKREKLSDSVVSDQTNDMADKFDSMKPATDNEESDMTEKRPKMPKSVVDKPEVDHALSPNKKKASGEGEPPAPRPTPPQHGEEDPEFKHKAPPTPGGMNDLSKAVETALGKPDAQGRHRVLAEGEMDMVAAFDKACNDLKTSCDGMELPEPMKAAIEALSGLLEGLKNKPPESEGAEKEAAQKTAAKHASRLERLYKARLDEVRRDGNEKLAALSKVATEQAKAKLVRAMKLAAKRQALNLEESPIKVAMFDTLTSEFDIDAESMYPGMDDITASVIIERAASMSFDEFANKVIDRADKLASMSDEAFAELEADVANLVPVSVVTASRKPAVIQKSDDTRRQVVAGNMHLAPVPSDTITNVPDKTNNRIEIREALGGTRVASTSRKTIKKD